MVFWCQRKTVRLFLRVKIFFSVWAMIVLGGELASEVSRRRTELASKPPKTLMANTENDIWTLRNTPNCSLFGNRNTIIRRCRSKTKLSWVIKRRYLTCTQSTFPSKFENLKLNLPWLSWHLKTQLWLYYLVSGGYPLPCRWKKTKTTQKRGCFWHFEKRAPFFCN